jgi:hypothetical protein
MVPSLNAAEVSENTFAPVDGAPVIAQPPRASAATARTVLESTGLADILVSSMLARMR